MSHVRSPLLASWHIQVTFFILKSRYPHFWIIHFLLLEQSSLHFGCDYQNAFSASIIKCHKLTICDSLPLLCPSFCDSNDICTLRSSFLPSWYISWLTLFFFCLQDKEPRGIIPLENLCVREVPYPRKPVRYCQLCFLSTLMFKSKSHCIE